MPVLTPRLSSYWVHLVTPVPSAMARPLIEGLRNETVVRDDAATRLFPHIAPVDYAEAVHRAVTNLHTGEVETRWADALASSRREAPPLLSTRPASSWSGAAATCRRRPPACSPRCCALGGDHGYGGWAWAWRARGALDRLVGGVGLRRGRRDPRELRVGDALDFWRVEAVQPERLLRLRAEMKVPGAAWLQFETAPEGAGTALVQTAGFAPRGLAGLLYWYGLYPVHGAIFSGMIAALAEEAGKPVA